MHSRIIKSIVSVVVLHNLLWALSGTGGVPLGGMGTGYLLFDGQKIRVSGKMPPAGADHCKTNPAEKQLSASGFYLFAGGTAKPQVKAAKEDARCPVQWADLGAVGDVKFTLNAFGPYWPGEGKLKHMLATSPMALFDVAAVNNGAAAVEVAVALEAALGSGNGKVDGNKAVSFAGSPENHYLAVDCDGTAPVFSAGALGTFSTNGTLSNADGNMVAAKCSIPAGGTVHFKFVISWYTTYDQEGYYYHNFYNKSKDAADTGLKYFDGIRDGITSFVDRVLASNFPGWYKDRLLNNTYPLIHNSVCAKDGRVGFWEGNYGIIGTIDQGQHAAVFYTFNWPAVQWHELQYWAQQQKNDPMGQIHHDFNEGKQSFTPGSSANNRHLKAWDDKTHADYWWFPNTDTWSDLNCMFILKAYELTLATGDLDSLKKSWDAIKKSANRLLNQAGTSKLFESSHSTYDQKLPGSDQFGYTPRYCASIALPSFYAMIELAKVMKDDATATKYSEAYTATRAAFDKKYSSDPLFGVETNEANGSRFNEGSVAGYSWANYLCLPPIMNETFISSVLTKMRNKQKSGGVRANGEWIFYNVDHYGGSEIAINQPDAAMVIHQQDYDEYYKNNPDMVFWQSLQKSEGSRHKDSYMTAPVVWHSYFQFCGYLIDNANKRLWIRPRIPSVMKGEITNAILLNPKGHGTLNYKENENSDTTQTIKVAFDVPVSIKEIMLKNNTGTDAPSVLVNNAVASSKTEGVSPEKNIRVSFGEPVQIGPEGIEIIVLKVPVKNVLPFEQVRYFVDNLQSAPIVRGKPVVFSVEKAGQVVVEALALNGARIGTLYSGNVGAGRHSFSWTGSTLDGKKIGNSTIVLRLVTASGKVARRMAVIE